MISRVSGKLVDKTDHAVILDVQGLCYEILVPASVLHRIDDHCDASGRMQLITYYYMQLSPSTGIPVMIGFINEIEREFFLQFIKVSGIGPRAAIKALNKPISDISRAISQGDIKFLKTLPGIGEQKAKEIVAKLQSKVGRYGLIQDHEMGGAHPQPEPDSPLFQQEALQVLLQLQYKKPEALDMIRQAVTRCSTIQTTEELLNEIYQQRIAP
jgi:Holliday junction DNA helicase RuvA